MRNIIFCLFLAGVFCVASVKAQSAREINTLLSKELYRMEPDAFIRLCDSLVLLYPRLTHDIFTYRLKAHYDNAYLADAIYDLEIILLNPVKKSGSRIDITGMRQVIEPIAGNYHLTEQYFNAGYYPECVPLLYEIHKKCSFFWQSHYMLLQCLDSMKLHDSAMNAIEYGINQTSSPHLYAARVGKAFERGMYQLAFNDASYLIDNGYDDADVFFYRSKIYMESGRIPEAMADMQKANNLSPGNSAYLMHTARLYFYSQQFDVANSLYATALKRGIIPDSIDAQKYLVSNFLGSDPDSDVSWQMIAFSPGDPTLFKLIIEFNNGNADTVLAYLDMAIERFPNEISFYAKRAQLRWEKNPEDPQIKRDKYKLVDLQPDTILWHEQLHTYVIYRNSKEAAQIRKRARTEMHKLLERDTNVAGSWYQLAKAYSLLDFIYESPAVKRKAIEFYSQCIKKDSSFYQAYYERAHLEKWVNNDVDAFLRDMRKALSINENWHYRHSIAWELSHAGRNKEALDEINQAIELYPNFILLYETRARFYEADKQPALAELDLKKAEELKSLCQSCPPPPSPEGY